MSKRSRSTHHFGVIALVAATLAAIVVIAWGVAGSSRVTKASIAPVDAQFSAVVRGTLKESTRVTGTVSSGEIISLVVPQATSRIAAAAVAAATSPAAAGATQVPAGASPSSTVVTTTSAAPTTTAAPSVPGSPNARVITAISTAGTVLKAGDAAFSVDGHPTIVLPGAVPAWRPIGSNTTDGVDVQQLEAFLESKGYTADGDLVVDESVDDSTVTAIEEWQAALGVEQTGSVELGEVAFHNGDLTVVALNAKLGEVVQAGESVLDTRTGEPFVAVSTDASWAKVGESAKVSSGSASVNGSISQFADGIAKITIGVNPQFRDGASATVTLSRTKVADHLLVPASAILVSDVDGPTVAVQSGNATKVVRVKVVAAANGMAAIEPSDPTRIVVGTKVRQF